MIDELHDPDRTEHAAGTYADGATKRCPYCAEEIRLAAVKCRYCGSMLSRGSIGREWYRLREGKMLAGVCAGLADVLGVSVTALRLAAVVLTLVGFGWGVLIYLVLWVIMPYRERLPGVGPSVGDRSDPRGA